MQKDINKGKTGDQKYQQKTDTDAQVDAKIAELKTKNMWYSYPVAEGKMQAKGVTFRQAYAQGNGRIDFEIYHDENVLMEYYDRKIRTDLAAEKPPVQVKEGFLYINPAYEVAIYYFKKGEGAYNVFKVRILKV